MSEPPAPASVTAVIPTRNRAARLGRALRSVLDQSEPCLEIIVVDDGSTDETQKTVEGLARDGLYLASHDSPRGAAAARNTGLRLAHGEYIAFLDDDDVWSPTKLARQRSVFEAAPDHVGLVYCGFEVVSDATETVVVVRQPRPAVLEHADFLRETGFPTSIPMMRRTVLETVGGFDEALEGFQDRDLWLRLSMVCSFQPSFEVLATHMIHKGQITADLAKKVRSYEQFLGKYRREIEPDPKLLAYHLERLGLLHLANGGWEVGRDYLKQVLELNPERDFVKDHLRGSASNREHHRAELLQDHFLTVDGVTLFY